MKNIIKLLIFAFILSGFTACFPVMMTHGEYNRSGHYWMYNNQRYSTSREYNDARRQNEHRDNNNRGNGNSRGNNNHQGPRDN